MTRSETAVRGKTDGVSFEPIFLRDLALAAANTLMDMWDSSRSSFWRSTEHRAAEVGKAPAGIYPTVSFRSLEALLRLIAEYPAWVGSEVKDFSLKVAVPAILTIDEQEMRSTLSLTSEGGVLNPFTLSLYTNCLARIGNCASVAESLRTTAQEKLRVATDHLLRYSSLSNESFDTAKVHPFVLFHLIRAIKGASVLLKDASLESRMREFSSALSEMVKKEIRLLLAHESLGVINPGEGVALAFCAAVLATAGQPEESSFLSAALKVAFQFQDKSGCWPLGRIVPENKDIEVRRDLQIPTYEIAWGVTEALLCLVESRRYLAAESLVQRSFPCLVEATRYITASVVQLEHGLAPRSGWCSEHAFGKPTIESWTSATVLHAVLSFYELSQSVARRDILQRFSIADPNGSDWPKWQRWQSYKQSSEPESDIHILDYIDRKIVRPIRLSPGQLPSATDRTVSMLLFGPPGTAKTTLVKAFADGLGWPVVFLSPGNFIERGLEFIEAQAKSVFELLQRLSRTVVLFDECDELFRDRKPLPNTDQVRNITAFVTASMLPKLQDLHDRGRVVFAICTNHIESMDPAIKRGGRIDHLIGIGPPDRGARRRIIEQSIPDRLGEDHVVAAVDELATESERFTRSEIERAAKMIDSSFESDEQARADARGVVAALKPSLTISAQEFENFSRTKKEFSFPHQEGGMR